MPPKPSAVLDPVSFSTALSRGHLVKVLRAVKAGQPLDVPHPTLGGQPQSCLAALPWYDAVRSMAVLNALLAAGADPNREGPLHRRPLHTMIWLHQAPLAAIDRLLDAGAHPFLLAGTAPGKAQSSAVALCLQAHRLDVLERTIERGAWAGRALEATDLLAQALRRTRAQQDTERAMDLLLDAGANPDPKAPLSAHGQRLGDVVSPQSYPQGWALLARVQSVRAARALDQTVPACSAPTARWRL